MKGRIEEMDSVCMLCESECVCVWEERVESFFYFQNYPWSPKGGRVSLRAQMKTLLTFLTQAQLSSYKSSINC